MGVVWRRKSDVDRFYTAREGDMWASPFQCEYCWWINLEGREVDENSRVENRTLGYIRRVNLDLLWARERGTVRGALTQVNKLKNIPRELGLSSPDLNRGPWPVNDQVGMRIAIITLRASQNAGKHNKSYTQFDTIRKIRSGLSSIHDTSGAGQLLNISFKGEKGKGFSLTDCPTDSSFYKRFMLGLEKRMGRVVKSNIGLDHKILLEILDDYNCELTDTNTTWSRRREIITTGAYFTLCFGASLRGNEGLFLEGSSLCSMIHLGKGDVEHPHVCAPLLGRFKTEINEDKHVALICNKSISGIDFRLWLERLVWLLVREEKNMQAGPAFCDEQGNMLRSFTLNAEFHQALSKVQTKRPDLIPQDLEVEEHYGIFRSLRRGSLTRATEQGIKGPDLDMINRWRKFEANEGMRPHMSMREHYLEIKLILKRTLAYSKVL